MSERFGQVLSRYVPLSNHDINEILHEQLHARQPFGELAIALGKCTPQDVWAAWCDQKTGGVQRVDLDRLGVDSQAVELLSRDVAMSLPALPLRMSHSTAIIATTESAMTAVAESIKSHLSCPVKLVVADDTQLQRYLAIYYSPVTRAG